MIFLGVSQLVSCFSPSALEFQFWLFADATTLAKSHSFRFCY